MKHDENLLAERVGRHTTTRHRSALHSCAVLDVPAGTNVVEADNLLSKLHTANTSDELSVSTVVRLTIAPEVVSFPEKMM